VVLVDEAAEEVAPFDRGTGFRESAVIPFGRLEFEGSVRPLAVVGR
jgi:hypothetical protein